LHPSRGTSRQTTSSRQHIPLLFDEQLSENAPAWSPLPAERLYWGVISSLSISATTEEIDWYAFLERRPLPRSADLESLQEQSILVTGAGGSIGSALSLQLASMAPRRLILLDASEQALYRLQLQLTMVDSPAIVTILGSVNDAVLLSEICSNHQPDLVFHAAAHKHAPLLEKQPLAAIATNTLGTSTLVECLGRHGNPRLVLLSTDKAVEPSSILGATKRVAELVTLSAGGIVLRLANVLGSEGSVVETFLQRIAAGGPITITHPQAERFFLTGAETVDLLLTAATSVQGPSLLIPRLEKSHRISALATFLTSANSPAHLIECVFTGLRPGEKLDESLFSADERAAPSVIPGLVELQTSSAENHNLAPQLSRLAHAVHERNLAQAMETLREIVPTYQISPQLQQLVDLSRTGVPTT